MAEKNESQQILEQIAQARHDALLWQTPNIQSTQTPENFTGGIVQNYATQTGGINVQAIQQQQALEMQGAMAQQMYLRSYANGTPGVMSPVQALANPTAANYQLQNMYMLNPYMANFMAGNGGGGGGGGMSIAPASMMTAPSYGVFRNNFGGAQAQPTGAASLFRDVATLNSLSTSRLGGFVSRSFAPYEDPIDEMIAARRRNFRRGENLAVGSVSIGAAVASFAAGGPMGLAIGLGLEPAVDTLGSAYFQRRAETEQLSDISKRIATGTNATGFRHRGFSLQESAQMMKGFRKEAAASPYYNMSDYMQVMDVGSENGLFMGAGNAHGAERKVKDMVGMIDVFMRVAGDPDVRSAMERMGKLQTMGFSLGQMNGAVGHLRAAANLAGTSVDQIMSTSGAYGAQAAVSMGASAGFGMVAGATAQGVVESMTQRGTVSALKLSLAGGKEGLTQRVTQGLTNEVYTNTAQNLAAFVKNTGNGLEVDQAAYDKYLATGKIPGGHDSLIKNAMANLGQIAQSGQMANYLQHEQELTAKLTNNLSPIQQISSVMRAVNETRHHLPRMSEDDVLFMKFGNEAGEWKDILHNAPRELLAQQREVMATKAVSAKAKYIRSQSFFSQIGTGLSSTWEKAVNAVIPFEAIASWEQARATETEGKVFLHDLNYGAAGGAKADSLAKLGYGREAPVLGPLTSTDHRSRVYDTMSQNKEFSNYLSPSPKPGPLDSVFYQRRAVDPTRQERTTRIESLERFNAVRNTTPDAVGSVNDVDMQHYRDKWFTGSGTSRSFRIDEAMKENISPSKLSLILSTLSNAGGEDALALSSHEAAAKLVSSVPAMEEAKRQKEALKDLENFKITPSVATNMANFGALLADHAKKGSSLDKDKLTALEQSLLDPKRNYDAVTIGKALENAGVDTSPDLIEKIQSSRAAIYDQAAKDDIGRGGLQNLLGSAKIGKILLGRANEAGAAGQAAMADLRKAENVAPPSAFAEQSDVRAYQEAQNTLSRSSAYAQMFASGKTSAANEDEFYKTSEGKAASSKLDKLNSAADQSNILASTTNQNLDLNPQLSEKQNTRRMANALDNIETSLANINRLANGFLLSRQA